VRRNDEAVCETSAYRSESYSFKALIQPIEINAEKARPMKWQDRVEKAAIALNLIGLGLGFCVLGILILSKRTIAGGSWIHGILGIVVGLILLLFAFHFCKHTMFNDRGTARHFSTRPTSRPLREGTLTLVGTARSLA
jgi:hypothetical protein